MVTLFALAVLAGAACYFMTPEERKRMLRRGVELLGTVSHAAVAQTRDEHAFNDLLRARSRWPIVTPAIAIANVAVFLVMLIGPGAFADPQTQVAWGANYLPRTGNGEWWRLATSMFVHAGLLHLLATIVALVSFGVLLERLLGSIACAAVYLTSGVVAAVVSLWNEDLTRVTLGASGALFGMYGLAIATAVYGCLRAPRLAVPLKVAQRVAAGAAIFALYNLVTDHIGTPAELAALATGLAAGFATAGPVVERKPSGARTPLIAGVTVALALVCAVPLRGMIDARPELARIGSVEDRTSAAYADAVDTFKRGRMSAKALATLIERDIVPPLQADRMRIDALRGAPRDQAPLLTAARRYFDLRLQSWHRRAEGLRTGKLPTLNDAERLERDALAALTLALAQ